ncbi:hypothetical protein VA596_24680 [Amycolatopsis sp., V23-08]|uniref:Uncharacterized protein n=1 Tax=Amycolatopsis heterodermiae TaxID=3110235 RepID=A0ABU5RAW7_9PSEU|nr:hypothetical protein [Amycolatopsis sp., V23-08]MEA5362755.1 hypothetical protein [Amycolatopsis sp., V23-08]
MLRVRPDGTDPVNRTDGKRPDQHGLVAARLADLIAEHDCTCCRSPPGSWAVCGAASPRPRSRSCGRTSPRTVSHRTCSPEGPKPVVLVDVVSSGRTFEQLLDILRDWAAAERAA